MTAFERLAEAFREQADSLISSAPQLLQALLVLALFVWLGRLFARGAGRLLARGHLSSTHRAFFRGLVAWGVALFGVAIALSVLGLTGIAAGILTGGSVSAIVLGFAFRGIGENLLAGFFLAFSRPFEVGDLIESEGFQGVVRGIELRSTHVRTSDGRDIYIPSAQIFNAPLVNYTRDYLRKPSFRVGLDYRDDLAGARRLLLETIQRVEGVLAQPPPAVYAAATEANYVAIEISFWVDTRAEAVPAVRGRAIEDCVRALATAGFRFSSEVTTGVDVEVPGTVSVALPGR